MLLAAAYAALAVLNDALATPYEAASSVLSVLA